MTIKNIFCYALILIILISCGSYKKIEALPIQNTLVSDSIGKEDVSTKILKAWAHKDLIMDTLPGMSLDRAYQIINERPRKTVIVGVIDSGVDIDHEDLKNVIWTNSKEIAGNGQDDDKNGYIDDIHGWNFLGNAVHENLEFTRIVKKGDDGSKLYKEAKEEYDKKLIEAKEGYNNYGQMSVKMAIADSILIANLGKEDYTLMEVSDFLKKTDNIEIRNACSPLLMINLEKNDLKEIISGAMKYFNGLLDYNLNLEYDGRKELGDDPDDFSSTQYGDGNVKGPDVEETLHGTHVAGIIAAQRSNDIGMDGVADHVKIMVIRAVPDGDEYDKDISLSIRYAVDNGAKVINASFGKAYSPHYDKVKDAIMYAASKDVLIVAAAGNEGQNIDINDTFPTDTYEDKEVSDNVITVGALGYNYGGGMIANFSNYGKNKVDIFAPGVKIWSTVPNNNYKYLQGTSMASPEVAGVAALIRSLYPKLTASQVKHIIMESGLPYFGKIKVGSEEESENFADISKSGKIVNAYNAIILANKVARKEIALGK